MSASDDQQVVVVTGGGGGIGAAIAIELGRRGHHVVTVDPLVSVDGTEQLPTADDTTADRIVAAGGSARASNVSVTDREAVHELFAGIVGERGRLDGVVNVAGITRPTGFAKGDERDWAAVLAVHLDGYCNVLNAALPIMAASGCGRIVGVTSGSGWRASDAGAYSCAKRAVASLTWQLGRASPPGVAINAISPIAMTRMVTAALDRARAASGPRPERGDSPGSKSGGARATGGLSLAAMPAPEDLGPLGAHLATSDDLTLRGQVLFAGGSEVAVVRPPRWLEVVRTPDPRAVVTLLDTVLDTWLAAEAQQATTGGTNPRFPGLFADANGWAEPIGLAAPDRRVLVVGDGAHAALTGAQLRSRGVATVDFRDTGGGVAEARALIEHAVTELGGLDAVVVETPESAGSADNASWQAILADHTGLSGRIAADAHWARAAADHVATTEQPLRLVTLVHASTPAGRSRAQAAAQLARAGAGATHGRVMAFTVSIEDREQLPASTALAALLAVEDRAAGLAGAELAVGAGWVGLRSHPTPAASVVFGGPELPEWFDAVLGEMAGANGAS